MLFLLSSFWNAAIDIGWGIALARSERLRRWAPQTGAVASVIACLSFAALPWLPPGADLRASMLLVTFRTAFALFDAPHNALSSDLASLHGHLRINRLRTIGSSAAGVVVAAAAIPLLAAKGSLIPALALTMLGVLALALLSPLLWLLSLGREAARNTPVFPRPGAVPASAAARVLVFCLIHMAGIGTLAAVGKAMLHLDSASTPILTVAPALLAAARLGGIPLWSALARQLGTTTALALAYAASAGSIVALPSALLAGAFASAPCLVLLGVAIGGVVLLVWTAFSELLANGGSVAEPVHVPLYYGLFTASVKIGLGGSAFLAGAWIAASSSQHQQLHDTAAFVLAALVAPVAMLCGLCELLRAYLIRPACSPISG